MSIIYDILHVDIAAIIAQRLICPINREYDRAHNERSRSCFIIHLLSNPINTHNAKKAKCVSFKISNTKDRSFMI